MKRIFSLQALLMGLLLLAGTRAIAQDDERPPRVSLTFGPKIGVNLSKLDGESWDGGYKTNLLGGAWLGLLGSRFGIQIEGLFSQTTYVTGQDFNSIYKQYIQAGKDSLKGGSFRVNYFNIPLLVQVRILNRVWLQLGPQYSGVVSIKDKDEFVRDASALFSKGSVSGVAGLWIDMTRHLNLGARYVQGFSNMSDVSDISEKWKMRDVQIHLGYRF